ncbi:hypothetical protein B0J14DRAFT_697829 [Halenospora varia]|nr:hypothetical protein B0J14DRAFT_697829 [Halenospora varia]
MANPKKTYHLAPNFHIPAPPTGPLTLGTIITAPSTPERTLTATPLPVSIPPSQIYTSSQKNWSATRSSLSSYSGGVWTTFLASIVGIGADVEGDVTRGEETEFRVGELETRWFSPGEEFIEGVLAGERVRKYMERTVFGKAVFMVVGIKVARGWSEGASSRVRGVGGRGRFKEDDFNKGALFEDQVGGGNDDEEFKWEWEDVRDGDGEGEDNRVVDVANDDVDPD